MLVCYVSQRFQGYNRSYFNCFKVICLTESNGQFSREGQSSDLRTVNSGVPQGSGIGPLPFLIYINDITDDLASLPLIYANDTTLFETVDEPAVSAGRLNSDLNKISEWADKWLVTMNPVNSRNVVFSRKRNKEDHHLYFLTPRSSKTLSLTLT